ncbi:hypothetical protein GGH99_008966, partial [Coemansia sp. RSA 1285]
VTRTSCLRRMPRILFRKQRTRSSCTVCLRGKLGRTQKLTMATVVIWMSWTRLTDFLLWNT